MAEDGAGPFSTCASGRARCLLQEEFSEREATKPRGTRELREALADALFNGLGCYLPCRDLQRQTCARVADDLLADTLAPLLRGRPADVRAERSEAAEAIECQAELIAEYGKRLDELEQALGVTSEPIASVPAAQAGPARWDRVVAAARSAMLDRLEAWKPLVCASIRMVQARGGSPEERAATEDVVAAVNNLPFPLRPEEG